MKKLLIKILLSILLILVVISGILVANHKIRNNIEKNDYTQLLGENLRIVDVKGKKISCYVQGEGNKTIVLLSGYGTPSPIANFMPLSNELSKQYKVVTIEYFGYGFSDSTTEERNIGNFVEEIRTTLQSLKLKPPYILMPHSFSGIYSMQYVNMYPEEVEAIIGLDESKPNQMKNNDKINKQNWEELKSLIGLYRIIDWLNPNYMEEMFFKGIDKNIYSPELIKLMHADFVWNYNTKSNINEENMMYENAKKLFNIKYPDVLPVLSIICSKNVEKESLGWVKLHEEVISNPEIQKIKILEGRHYIHYTQINSISELASNFLENIKIT